MDYILYFRTDFNDAEKNREYTFFIQAHYFSDLYNFVFVLAFVFAMFLVFEKLEK